MSRSSFLVVGLLAVSLSSGLIACDGANPTGDDVVDAAGTGTDSAIPAGWTSLLEGDWSLQPGEESYYCVYATVPRDIYIKAFRPLGPVGTHHTVLTLYSGTTPDGTVPCGVGTNGQSMVYGSGVGSPDFTFPAGVGLHLRAGQRLLLNLHLYNSSDAVLTGRSGTFFQEGTAAEIQNEAEIVLAGPTVGLRVPTGTSTQSGRCNISSITSVPVQVFSLSQHMHKLGTHMRSVITRGASSIMLQDIDYRFEEQGFQIMNPHIQLLPGDVLTTYCTYTNPGAQVNFGESSDDEMCFTDLFYYPAQGADFICTGL